MVCLRLYLDRGDVVSKPVFWIDITTHPSSMPVFQALDPTTATPDQVEQMFAFIRAWFEIRAGVHAEACPQPTAVEDLA